MGARTTDEIRRRAQRHLAAYRGEATTDELIAGAKTLVALVPLMADAAKGLAEAGQWRLAAKVLSRTREAMLAALSVAIDLAALPELNVDSKSDAELWRIHDANLRREAQFTDMRVKALTWVWFAERPIPRDFDTFFIAGKTAHVVAENLGIRTPTIRWFSECGGTAAAKAFQDSPGTIGKAGPGEEIWVHRDLSARDVIATVAHEMKHLEQKRTGALSGDLWTNLEDAEREAYAYGKRLQLTLWGPHGSPGGRAYVWRENAHQAMTAAQSPK